MTDADVDGSHIRTLLLTFLFRQFKELLTNEYIYIAQPPLYRVKKGSSEVYIKDEKGLTAHLADLCFEKVQFADVNFSTKKEDRKQFLFNIEKLEKLLTTLDKNFERDILTYLLQNQIVLKDLTKDKEKAIESFSNLKDWIDKRLSSKDAKLNIKFKEDPEHEGYFINIDTEKYGVRKTSLLSFDFAESTEWLEFKNIWESLKQALVLPTTIDDTEYFSYTEIYSKLMTESKKGLYIQRYKGLGEMNPDQLWETTLNPENRTLLRVSIEDGMEADETFSILMGDDVEPRRNFINENALLVKELDI